MSVYPGSMPAYIQLMKNGALTDIASAGAIIRECFCGPCFGAGDTPANGEFSIRHTTRNFPNREGSKPGEGQMAGVALMDARSIAATAINGGRLTAATDLDVAYTHPQYFFDGSVYEKRVYNGYGKAEPEHELRMGPNIKDWPEQPALSDDLLVKVVSYITDPVTTTDELIPSGETSSYRSNPLRLAEFALSRKDPAYVGRAKAVHAVETARERGEALPEDVQAVYAALTRAGVASNPARRFTPTSRATVPPASRPQAASAYSARARTSRWNTPPSAIAATASTGAWRRCSPPRRRITRWATGCSCPAFARRFSPAGRRLTHTWSRPTAALKRRASPPAR